MGFVLSRPHRVVINGPGAAVAAGRRNADGMRSFRAAEAKQLMQVNLIEAKSI
jgi:hypothetical protein